MRVYGFPLVDSYRVQHAFFVDAANAEDKGPWNTISNTARVYTPEDRTIQTPNSDTPCSSVGLDLRAEPIVLTLPRGDPRRYVSVQLIDAYTHNFAYLGSRTTGNDGGSFLIAGPQWKGEPPRGITQVIRSETSFTFALYRTQLFDAADIEAVKQVQAGYRVQTLSQFLGVPTPQPAPLPDFPRPQTAEQQKTSADFFGPMNFVLGLSPTHPSEKTLMARFAKLGIGPGLRFDAASLSPELCAAVEAGMADAWQSFGTFKATQIDTGRVTSGDLFGTRQFLKNDYMRRMTGAVIGIYGNTKQEAMYPVYFVDSAGGKLDGARSRYTLRFARGQLPPVDAFWSLTMYELPSSLLSANPIGRYLLNSPMLPAMKRDPDGGLTLIVQHDSPRKDLESNWLPAPDGPFWMVLRLYRPKAAALERTWKEPAVRAVPAVAGTGAGKASGAAAAGGINRMHHIRMPTPIAGQTVVRMSKDTL
jgi:hypothetical protein